MGTRTTGGHIIRDFRSHPLKCGMRLGFAATFQTQKSLSSLLLLKIEGVVQGKSRERISPVYLFNSLTSAFTTQKKSGC